MHIPWTWAKQRPQFLAQELSKTFDVQVVHKKPFSQKNQSSEKTSIPILEIPMLPFNAKSGIVRFFNKIVTKLATKTLLANSKYVWITSPDLFDLLPKLDNDQILIYDCMDDMLSFSTIKDYPSVYKYYFNQEKKLLEQANVILCSSNNLRDKLINRYNITKKINILNNGISDQMFTSINNNSYSTIKREEDRINIVYVGTIAKWMDWDLIIKSLELNDRILYHFVGPQEMAIPIHERILSYGPQPHVKIKYIMTEADILCMPFVVTDLIKSVNPVKLYEYIYSGKASLSVRYEESELFDKFVHLYSDINEYMDIIEEIKSNKFVAKSNFEESIKFCKDNTWTVREKEIEEILLNKTI